MFQPRDLMIRQRDEIAFRSLSPKRQAALFLILCAVVGWSAFTSYHYLRFNPDYAAKQAELSRLRGEYADLQGEVSALSDRLNLFVAEMDEAGAERREKTAAQPADDDSGRLREEAGVLRERLAVLAESGAAENGRLSYHQALLQRDIATAEARALQKKVGNLEKQIAGMQDTQLLVFRKMATLAGGNIDAIENDLSGIRQALAATGLGMDSLVNRIRRDKENVGIGGPFIPAPMSKPQHHLNISLVSLNQRLDRWYDLTTLQDALPIGKPIERIRVTSPFGSRGDPFQGAPAHHEAVDLGGMMGEPVRATAPGKVVRAGRWGWYGNMVEIDHGLGFRTRYAHMDKVFVTNGDTVRSGDKIGTVGNSGRSTGPHLHYEIRVRGQAVDPMKFIKAKRNVFKS